MTMTLKHVYVASLILILAQMASAQAVGAAAASSVRSSKEIENSCKIKAKEIAAETYRGCVSEQKNAQIDQIKKEYSAKLQALKAHYDSELKKMAGGAKAEAKQAAAAEAKADAAKPAAEIKIQLKQAAAASAAAEADDSTMDIPEPIPVESSGI